jgi:predicted nucleic acid-binding protein
MTVKVVDASALAALLFGEPDAEAVEQRLRDAILVAPRLIEYELGNTCWKKCRQHPELADALKASFGMLPDLQLQLQDVDSGAVLDLARELGITFHDTAYLWLARQLQVELVSIDARLIKAGTPLV